MDKKPNDAPPVDRSGKKAKKATEEVTESEEAAREANEEEIN